MPQRMVDGDAVANSKKLRKVDECWRIHYPYWLTLAEANGTFEVDPEIIHGRLYPTGFMPTITVESVRAILAQYIKSGLVVTWKERGSRWGVFSGQEKAGRLPVKAHLSRYKDLPPTYPGRVREESRANPAGFGLGLDRLATGLDTSPVASEENMAREKGLHKRIAQIWQEMKGSEGAVCPYPHFQKDGFEDLARMHSHDAIADAFRLYAQEAPGPEREKYPIDKFMINANDYMLRARPATEHAATPADPALKQANEELILKLAREATERMEKPGPVRSEVSAEDFLNQE